MKNKKRYTVIDNKTGKKFHYSEFIWSIAWFLVWLFGVIIGAVVTYQTVLNIN